MRLQTWLRRAGSVALMGALTAAALIGCECCTRNRLDKCADVTPGALPQPLGSFVHRFQKIQSDKAEADDFVVYLHEWFLGGDKLGPYGEYHVAQIAKRLHEVPFPVVIQMHPDPGLNTVRLMKVGMLLEAAGVQDARTRVVLGNPQAEGMYGDLAPLVYRRMLIMGLFGGGYGGYGGMGGYGGFGGLGGLGAFGGGAFGGFGGYGGIGY